MRPLPVLAILAAAACSSEAEDEPAANGASPVPAASSSTPGPVTPAPPPTTTGTNPVPPGPPPPPPKVDVFMASGHMGRTIMSCDDGVTWINDRSDDDAARCWVTGDPHEVECDHSPYSGHGIDSGDGWFFTNFGWGYNGSVRRSRDGVVWETMKSDGWGGGVAYAKKSLFLMWGGWFSSPDQGATWVPNVDSPAGTFDHPYVRRAGNKLFAFPRAPGGMAMSTDGGVTWTQPPSFQAEWGGWVAEGNGTIVTLGQVFATDHYVGYRGHSSDGGATWQGEEVLPGSFTSWVGVVFNGTDFVAWSPGTMWKSHDGATWTSAPLVAPGDFPPEHWSGGPVGFNTNTGTYIMIPNGWGSYYEKQRAFRSKDGIAWTQLDAAHFKGGHPLFDVTLASVDPKVCP